MRHRGDCAQEALRVDRSFVVKMFGTEEGDIDPCQNVRPILRIAIAQEENGRIDGQENDDSGNHPLMRDEYGEERNDAIAQRYALEHRPDAQMREAPEIAVDGMCEPVYGQSDEEQQYGSFQDFPYHLLCRLELVFRQREIGGNTHDEEEEGKHQVAWCHTIPLGVFEHLERLHVTIVHHNHSRDSDTSEDIEREEALLLCSHIVFSWLITE